MEFDTQKFVKLIHREMNTNLQSFFLFFPLHPISQIFRQNNQYFFLSPLFILNTQFHEFYVKPIISFLPRITNSRIFRENNSRTFYLLPIRYLKFPWSLIFYSLM